ncbi:sensor histidine kinase [Geodermatophilus sp. SYSU D01119]
MPTVARWWRSRTDPQRIELYTRWSYYGFLATLPLFVLLAVASDWAGTERWVELLLAAATLGTVAAAVQLSRRGFADRAARPDRALLAVVLVCGAVVVGAASAATGDGPAPALPWAAGFVGAEVLLALSVTVPTRPLVAGAGVVGLLTAVVALLDGNPPLAAVAIGLSIAVAVGSMTLAFRFSVWILDVVVEMDRSRGVQLRLAVAEERLRFARDLHDVMGRNLSAIAVKSQLAGELVRRGRPDAADEVADISRIAEESLREVRDVVRGYRSTDLAGELAGARSVLRAAGIACTVQGEEAGTALPPEAQAALGWVVREAVTNVLRHSSAGSCTITLVPGDPVELRVENDGVSGAAAGWGNGLRGLAERLAAASGHLSAGRVGDRFVVVARVPARVPAVEEVP